ncbi:MAG: hemolysin III family protein [Flavobacteriales bacterium]|nr:hemolysin III family protein [Flavobacteriales bacterium]
MAQEYSGAHERANTVTHFLGFLFGLVTFPLLVRHILIEGGRPYDPIGAVVYGIGFLMVFGFSSLYHFHKEPKKKRLMKIWDHISIYFLIAGTYTPFLLHYATPRVQWNMLAVLWGLTALGTVFKVFFTGRFRLVSTGIYLAMGWLIILAPTSFRAALPDEQVQWIFIGGAFYTLGTIFYLIERIPFNHAIWHVFVLGGAVSHFIGIWKIFA